MAYRYKHGMAGGDVLNPTAGTALNCGLLAGGVFSKACWCLQFPSLCSSADYQAAYALAHPDVYVQVQPPPVVGAPTGPALTLPPASGADAQAQIAALLAEQNAAQNAQSMATMQQTAANLQEAAQTQCPGETLIQNADGSYSCPSRVPTWVWIALAGIGALALLPGPGWGGGRAL